MRGRFKRTSIFACLSILGAAGAAGLGAGWYARAGLISEPPTVVAEMSATDTVHLRFPADWIETAVVPMPMPAMLAFASADGGIPLLSPQPIYSVADVPASPPTVASSAHQKSEVQAAVAPARIALASVATKPAVATPKPRSNAVLNDSQIASIRKRLNLTPDQERYWPAVAAELRKMEYKKDKSAPGTRTASVDLSKVNVEGLKSAGYPLVMSFNDDQRRELKSLTHLLGLESVMSGI